MFVNRFVQILVLTAILLMFTCVAWAFDYTRYKEADLDVIVNDKTWVKEAPSMSLTLLEPTKLKFLVTLENPAYPCSNGVLQAAMNMLGAGEILKQVPINSCVEVKTQGGAIVKMFIQDVLVDYLAEEVKPGEKLILYCDYLFWNANGPGILVNEFEAVD